MALWQAFYRIEPWGKEYERDAIKSMLLSQVSSIVAASVGAKVKPTPMQDFMPGEWEQPTVSENESSIAAAKLAIASRFKGPDK